MNLDQTPLSKHTKQMVLDAVTRDPEQIYFANPNVLEAETSQVLIASCPQIFAHLNSAGATFGTSDLSDEEIQRLRLVRQALLSALVEPLAYETIASELKVNPQYLFEFQQHEIPVELINVAIEADPAGIIPELWDMGFDFRKENCQIFLKNGLLIKYLYGENLPSQAFYNAVTQNKLALFHTPDQFAYACICIAEKARSRS